MPKAKVVNSSDSIPKLRLHHLLPLLCLALMLGDVMGSSSASNPYPWQQQPYDTYRDCSLGICTIYCSQWCMFFPPPPDSSGSGTYLSPLVISAIVILASAFLLVSYFTIFKKSCGQRRNPQSGEENPDRGENRILRSASSAGLDESAIKSIVVYKYKTGEGLVEGMDCSVCLSEFQDNQNLRLLPKCNHAFHLPCIDTWLKSHSNCPLCRANASPSVNELPLTVLPSPSPTNHDNTSTGLNPTVSPDSITAITRDEVVITVIRDDLSAESSEGHECVPASEDVEEGWIKPKIIGPSKHSKATSPSTEA